MTVKISFLWIELICLKAAEPLWGGSIVLNSKSKGIPNAHWLTSEGWKVILALEPHSDFELGIPGLVMKLSTTNLFLRAIKLSHYLRITTINTEIFSKSKCKNFSHGNVFLEYFFQPVNEILDWISQALKQDLALVLLWMFLKLNTYISPSRVPHQLSIPFLLKANLAY